MTETQILLEALLSAPGVSGDEGAAALAARALMPAAQWAKISPVGSLIAQLNPPQPHKPCLLVTAHLDEIGLVLTHPAEDGFVRASCVGGVDRRMAAGARVEINTPGGALPGVITSTPPHLQSGEPKLPESTLIIDIGGLPEDENMRPRPGMTARFAVEPTRLLCSRFTANSLDNRAGCAAVIMGAMALARKNPDFGVMVALTAAEETGGAGGATAAFQLDITHAVVVDMTMALTGFEPSHKGGKLGGGPMVGFAPALNYDFTLALESLAREAGIATEREVMAGSTGTDSEAIAKSGGGIKTALLSIPLRFMHTAGETVELKDIDETARLISMIGEESLC